MEPPDAGSAGRNPAALALLAATVVTAVVGLGLAIPAWSHLGAADAYTLPLQPLAALVYATLGVTILRRVRNPIGWLLLLEGTTIGVQFVTSLYAVVGVASTSLPAAETVGVVSEVAFVPVLMAIVLMLLLFPTGGPPSPRWRPVVAIAGGLTALTSLAFVVTPRVVALPSPGGESVTYPNPLGVSALAGTVLGTLTGLGIVSTPLIAAGAAALIVRYRSGASEMRQQIKWVALVGGIFVVAQVAITIALATLGIDSPVTPVVGLASAALALFGMPIAITVAILKYGLYEIDLILNRAVVYTLLAAAATIVYVAIVVGVGALVGSHGGPVLTIVAAVAIALLFQPLRQRARRVANRIVYGERASPYQVLSEFADAMANTLPLEEQLDRMVSLLASGTGATRVEVWIRVGPALRAVAVWPAGTAEPSPLPAGDDEPRAFVDATAVFPVRQDEEPLGAIVVHKPPNEPLAPAESSLAEHVASQAGLVVRNVRLTAELRETIEELRASRRRLVEAQDEERRKIERNLHDGAQQQLVALTVQLGLLERQAEDPETVRASATRLKDALQDALDELRALARGIYPPLLADQGLAAALEAQSRKAAVPTTIESGGIGRYPREIESAVYFCALEALQNVAKYADATSAVVRLGERDGRLEFEIADDGRGFDPTATSYGTGMQGMVDRLDAIGGTLEVSSESGRGTMVLGRIALPG
jgi:signal transduction histidine kinase